MADKNRMIIDGLAGTVLICIGGIVTYLFWHLLPAMAGDIKEKGEEIKATKEYAVEQHIEIRKEISLEVKDINKKQDAFLEKIDGKFQEQNKQIIALLQKMNDN